MGSFFSFVYSKIPHNTRYTTRPNKKGRVFFSSQSLWYFDTISDVMDQRYQLKKRIWLSIINGKSLNLDQLLELKTYVNLLLRHGIWSFEGTICWLSRALWKSTIWSFGCGRYHGYAMVTMVTVSCVWCILLVVRQIVQYHGLMKCS